jgi:hypothetical protein
MRRILLMTTTAAMLALGAPAVASAHHRAHAAHHHRRHHRTLVFKANSPSNTATPPSTETPSGEVAGTIASYEEGVLKITLTDGTTISGRVTPYTQIGCGCPGHDDGQGWQGGHWGQPGQPPGGQGDDEQSGESSSSSGCGVSSLVAGAKVKEAELSLSSFGAYWSQVDLVPPTTTTTQPES